MRSLLVFTLFIIISLSVSSQPPAGYYDNTNNLYGEDLLQELHTIVKNHTVLSYSDLWNAFSETDITSNGKVWDMYSDCTFTFGVDQDSGTGGNTECDVYNREHSFPVSWFGGGSPMYTDLFHIYPVDKKVNAVRANYSFGEVYSPTYISSNGSKLGQSSYSGFSGTVFEPIDEYKGDFARTMFYMATRYYDLMHTWDCDECHMMNQTQYPAFTEWALNMLLEWHELDPVSEKEVNRNNIIYDDYQGNRNPFIDRPEFVQRIWGDEDVSFDNVRYYKRLNVWPNPASSTISITTENNVAHDVLVYGATGQMVKSYSNSTGANEVVINVDQLPNGVYFVVVNDENVRSVGRFVVAR